MMIADSQEARMYVFMIASLAAYAGFVFEWERSGRPIMLAAAVGAMLVGIQFHQLVIFGSLMSCSRPAPGRWQKIAPGSHALAAIGVGYVAISRWTASFYPSVAVGYADPMPQLGQAPSSFGARLAPLSSAAMAVWASCWHHSRYEACNWADRHASSLLHSSCWAC